MRSKMISATASAGAFRSCMRTHTKWRAHWRRSTALNPSPGLPHGARSARDGRERRGRKMRAGTPGRPKRHISKPTVTMASLAIRFPIHRANDWLMPRRERCIWPPPGISRFRSNRLRYPSKAGWGCFVMDSPGTGECPVLAGPKAHEVHTAALNYLLARPEVDAARIAVVGASFGGYWSTKLAYVEHQRLRAAVNWGGGVHYFFQREW